MIIWKNIPGYMYPYQAGSNGQIKVLAKTVTDLRGFTWNHPERVMTPKPNRRGYLHINLFVSKGKAKTVDVHRIIAEVFIPNPDNKKEVNHINGNKSDNRIENLEWVSSKENKDHAWSIGLYKRENQGLSKRKRNGQLL